MSSERPVIHVVPSEPWGGIQALVPVLAREQMRRGRHVSLICLGTGTRIRALADRLGLGDVTRSLSGPGAPIALLAALRRSPDAIVHTHCEPIWASAVLALGASQRWVAHGHVYPDDTLTWKKRVSRRLQRHFATRHIAISHSVGRALVESGIATPATLDIVHNGIAVPERVVARTAASGGGFTIGFVGRVVAEKGIFDYLDLAASLVAEPRFAFAVYGEGADLAAAKERAGTLGLGGRVVFHGQVDAIEAAWATIDAAIVFSKREPFGLVFLEAALNGAASVSYANASGGSEVAATLRSAHQVAPGALAEAAATLRRLADDRPATAAALGEDRATIAARYAIATMETGVAAAYQRLGA